VNDTLSFCSVSRVAGSKGHPPGAGVAVAAAAWVAMMNPMYVFPGAPNGASDLWHVSYQCPACQY
jgi:hypothetical protein